MGEMYWAAKSGEDLAKKLTSKLSEYRLNDGHADDLQDRLLRSYYGYDSKGGGATSHGVGFAGQQGEFINMRVNHLRSLVQTMHTLITGTLVSLRAKAQSGDSATLARAEFADQLLEYYWAHKDVDMVLSRAALYGILLGEGWVHLSWDTGLGELYMADPSTGESYNEGDIRFTALRPDQVIRDPGRDTRGSDAHDWVMVEQQVNRWELVARFPEYEDEVLSLGDGRDYDGEMSYGLEEERTEDYVNVYHFYHARRPALPQGKYALLIGDDVVFEQDLPTDHVPVYGMVPDPIEGTSQGHPHAADLMAIQELYDGILSATATAVEAASSPVWWVNEADSLDPQDTEGGTFVSSMTPPELRQFQYNPGPSLEFLSLLRTEMELTSGINSVVRGDPDKAIQGNAKAMMTVHAQAFQRLNAIHRTYTNMTGRVGTGIIQMLRLFATTERVAELTGETGIAARRVWSGADLEGVDKVVVEATNPLHQSIAGRQQMAEDYYEKGWVRGPQEYTRVLTTGRIDPVSRQYRNQDRLIEDENRRMREGAPVVGVGEDEAMYQGMSYIIALATDDHQAHIQSHLGELDDIDVRTDPQQTDAVLRHIQHHVSLLQETDPLILGMVNPQMVDLLGMAAQMAPQPVPASPEGQGPPVDPSSIDGYQDEVMNPNVPVDGPQQVQPPPLPDPNIPM